MPALNDISVPRGAWSLNRYELVEFVQLFEAMRFVLKHLSAHCSGQYSLWLKAYISEFSQLSIPEYAHKLCLHRIRTYACRNASGWSVYSIILSAGYFDFLPFFTFLGSDRVY